MQDLEAEFWMVDVAINKEDFRAIPAKLASGLTPEAIKVYEMSKEQQAEQADVTEYSQEFLNWWNIRWEKYLQYWYVPRKKIEIKQVAWESWVAAISASLNIMEDFDKIPVVEVYQKVERLKETSEDVWEHK